MQEDAISSVNPRYAPIPDWQIISGMRRSATYEALARGDLRAIKVSTRTLIDVEHGLAWLASLPAVRIGAAARSAHPAETPARLTPPVPPRRGGVRVKAPS